MVEIIAERDSRPLVFHCTAGKDRIGVLAAMVLTAMGIVDEDVVEDYTLSAPLMNDIRDRAYCSLVDRLKVAQDKARESAKPQGRD